MALTSPGVEVTIIDQSQYLPAPIGTVPLVVFATAQNKANPTGTGVATGTTAANAGKLYQVTSQRDLVTLYGTPFFYTTTTGTPIQGYELNEYGLLAAYSALGVSNRAYCLRADIDLSSLVGQTGRPVGQPDDGTWWLDTTNSTWGIYAWNATTQTFTLQTPIVITDDAYMSAKFPIDSLGNIGQYAIYANESYDWPTDSSQKQIFYKTINNTWAELGSYEWLGSVPTVQGKANPTIVAGTFTIGIGTGVTTTNTATITISPGETITDVANHIVELGWTYLTARVVNNRLTIYSRNTSYVDNKFVGIASSTTGLLTGLGITAGNYQQPQEFYSTSSQMPLWGTGQTYPHPTGSVWIKIGSAGNGLNPVVSQYSTLTASWKTKTVSLATSDFTAIASLDSTGGALIPAGTVYGQYTFGGYTVGFGRFEAAPTFLWERLATGPTVATGENTAPMFNAAPDGDNYYLLAYASIPGSSNPTSAYTVTLPDGSDATGFVTAWSAAGIPNTSASVTTDGAIQLTHTKGGVILIDDTQRNSALSNYGMSTGVMEEAGFMFDSTMSPTVKRGTAAFVQFNPTQNTTTGAGINFRPVVYNPYGFYNVQPNNFSNAGSGYIVGETVTFFGSKLGGLDGVNDLQVKITAVNGSGAVTACTYNSGNSALLPLTEISNWVPFTYTANEGAPVAVPANNTNWFYSVVDQVDIMVNYNGQWYGYGNRTYGSNGFPLPSGTNYTDPNGPIVSASEPTMQSDGTSLVYGDLWIDTSDLEMYPIIRRWQQTGTTGSFVDKWVLIDNADQTSSSGVLFADARWATNGDTNPANDPIPTIKSLLTSNYLDLDAPSASTSPSGMLLFNTRRSGYNVKAYKSNYFNSVNFPGQVSYPTVTSTWLSESGLMDNGAPYMGRQAQRHMVVKSLRSVIDTNTDIRDEDNFFNLIATPNYPELQPNMVVLNNDRGDTGYILGDTPLGLPANATAIQAWATNAAGATSTGEAGCVTRDTYLGLFYPSGITSDLNGNLVVVPPSHMMLRTFIRNDTVAYPWFAAAGTRRGIIDNATNIGYLNRTTGEFETTKTNIGIRDVLYINFINPLVFFTGNGLLNYGNKTSYNSSSALDRTNVARLVAYIRRQLTLAGRPFVFEPNDALTRQQIQGVVQSLMIDLVAKRGIYDYLVVCDESNNKPSRIDRNELWVDVAVEPVKAAEFIYIPVRILNTGGLKN
jgi:Phage tail sheath C-terminal domain